MIQQLDHVNIVVQDLDGMCDFYSRVLGLSVTKRVTIGGEWVEQLVGLKDVHADVVYLDFPGLNASGHVGGSVATRIELIRYHRPTMATPPGIDQPHAPGIRHFAFRVTDLDGLYKRLEAAGVRFFSQVQQVPETQVKYAGGVRKRLAYFQDPEGNLLELCEYKQA